MATKPVVDEEALGRIGNTPLVKLESISKEKNTSFYAKLESHNPFGSVKDRAAYWMIKDAEEKGIVKKGQTIVIEPTSGNTGIALAGIAKLLGYNIEIVIPEKASDETKKIIESLGAKIYETSDDLCPKVGAGTDQSIALAKSIATSRPDLYYSPNQYENEANYLGHYKGTGPEIWKQTEEGKVDYFFTGAGTGGTITGVSTFLKEKNPALKTVAVQPQQNHLLQGLRNFEESEKPPLFKKRESVVDDWITVTNEEAFACVRELYQKERILVSPSSAAVYAAMKKYPIHENNRNNNDDDTGGGLSVVGIFADDGRKFKSLYLRQNVFTDDEFEECKRNARYMSDIKYLN